MGSMNKLTSALEQNAQILKGEVSRYAWIGLAISLISITIATLIVGYQMTGEISLRAIILAHTSNIALMILDATPLIFMFWGQSISTVMSYSASAMILDQTNELRMQTSGLQSKVIHDLHHDRLTDLPNRVLYTEYLNKAIEQQTVNGGQLAVLMINIQNFKDLNTGFGSNNADRLIVQFASRLQTLMNGPMILARFGGDEFAILMSDISKQNEAFKLFKKIRKLMHPPFLLEGVEIDLPINAGITFYPAHGKDADSLIHKASIAVYYALTSVKDLSVYSAVMDNGSQNKLILLSELRKAIDEKQLQIYFQPIVNLSTGKITNCEALLHWDHPTFGTLCTEKFILIAERTSLIKSVTHYVLEQSMIHANQWREEGLDLVISVNLSSVDIIDPDLPGIVKNLLSKHRFPADKLKLELIESTYLDDQISAVEVIKDLSELGVKIAIDDFGTGYSSFLYLANLPIHEVKIDKSFVMTMDTDEKKRNIVMAIIKLAHVLGLSVVAEGVENIKHMDFLIDCGCTYGQGFFFSKPTDAAALAALARAESYQQSTPLNKPMLVPSKQSRE